jgi:hypothetical protein
MGNSLIKVNDDKVQKDDEVNIEEWILVKGPAGSYLGKYVSDNHAATNVLPLAEGDPEIQKMKKEVIDKISQGDCIQLFPVFEFIAPLRPARDPRDERKMVMTRDPVIVMLDFVLMGAPIYVKAMGVYFGCDLKGRDAEQYKRFVQEATSNALQARAAASGLELVPDLGHDFKKGPNPRA